MSLEALTRRVTELEIYVKQMEEHSETLQLALSWLLAKHGEDAAVFLSAQANALEERDARKYEELVVTLDYLREDVARWRELWSKPLDKGRAGGQRVP